MRLISFPLAVCCMVVFGCGRNSVPPAIPTDSVIEKKIDSLIRKMTLEEKIGQMTEITVGVVTDKSGISLSEEMLDTVIGKYKVGSILNIPFGVGQPKEVFAGVVRRIQEKSLDVIGIPCIYGLDQRRDYGLRDARLSHSMDIRTCDGSRQGSKVAENVGKLR